MTDRAKLTAEIADARRSLTVVSWIVWTVAVVIMIYGIPIVYDLLVDHQVPPGLAWLLSPAVDGALAVGIIATNVLARLGQPYGWVGAIRWVAGITTWGLNTAGPWTTPNGVDWLGVLTHTAGPLILFVLVEGAAQFQHRTGKAIAEKEEKLASADAERAAERAKLTELTDRNRRLEADLRAAEAREQQYATDTTTAKDAAEAEVASARSEATAEVERIRLTAEAETGILRQRLEAAEAAVVNLRNTAEAATTEHAAALAKVRAEAAEKVARARAEARTPHLDDYRTGGGRRTTGGKTKTTTGGGARAAMTDEVAVQKCIAEHAEPNYPWAQAEIVKIVQCGWGRAPRLLEAIAEYHTGGASTATAEATSATTGGDTTAASEPTTEDPSAGSVERAG